MVTWNAQRKAKVNTTQNIYQHLGRRSRLETPWRMSCKSFSAPLLFTFRKNGNQENPARPQQIEKKGEVQLLEHRRCLAAFVLKELKTQAKVGKHEHDYGKNAWNQEHACGKPRRGGLRRVRSGKASIWVIRPWKLRILDIKF